jgi:starch synthase
MRIGVVAAEMAPLVKVGGLGDVAGALSAELASRGHEVTVLLPGYASLKDGALTELAAESVTVSFEGQVRSVPLRRGRLGKVQVVLVDDPLVAGRGPYDYADARDEAFRYTLLCRVGADWLASRVDVLQLHDHHASFVVPLLAGRPRPATLLTIHNMAYQGVHAWEHVAVAGVPAEAFPLLDWYGRANALKAAIIGADAVNAVSPTYAREIRDTDLGCGLQLYLQARGAALSGILNGIDVRVWDPAADAHLPATYSVRDMAGKAECKAALLKELGLRLGKRPLIGIVSRLTDQKGFDLLRPVMPEIAAVADLVVLGTGDARLEAAFRHEAGRHVGVRIGFDEALAHRIEAGSDLFLMPSRFEPCGLNQMISMRYGTLPVVRRTGGLADTVVDADDDPESGFGFVFDRPTSAALFGALFRGLKAIEEGRAPTLARRAMSVDVSWSASAARYERLMADLAAARPPR